MKTRTRTIAKLTAVLGLGALSTAPSSHAEIAVDDVPDVDPNAGIIYSTDPDVYARQVSQPQQLFGPWDPAQWIGGFNCPVPTVQDCLSPQFPWTWCGQVDTWVAQSWPGGSGCQFVVGSMLQSQANQVGAPDVVDMGTDGRVYSARNIADDRTAYFYRGAPVNYLDEQLSVQLEAKNPIADSFTWFTPRAIRRAAWTANGPAVGSCREYVWEKWYDLSKFEDDTGGVDGNFGRFLVDRAFDPMTGLVDRTIYSSDSLPQGRVKFPAEPVPKNAYFLFAPTAFDRYPFDPSVVPGAAGRAVHNVTWAWHASMSAALAGVPDAVLAEEHRRQVAFKRLLARRAALVDEIVEAAAGAPIALPIAVTAGTFTARAMLTDDSAAMTSYATSSSGAADAAVLALAPSVISSVLAGAAGAPISTIIDPLAGAYVTVDTGGYTGKLGQLYVLDKTIAAYLEHARDAGCLATSGVSVCDWSPTLLADQLRGQFAAERERDYQACLDATGDDFSPGAVIHDPYGRGITTAVAGRDHAMGAGAVSAFIAAYELYIATLEFTPQPGSLTDPAKGWWAHDAKEYGNANWNVGYDYTLGWGIKKASSAPPGLCNVDFVVQGKASANATLAGKSFLVLDGDNTLKTDGDAIKLHSHLKIFGKAIYSPIDLAAAGSINLPVVPPFTPAKPSVSTVIPICGVPVTVSAGLAGTVGIDATGAASLTRACTSPDTGTLVADASASITPHAEISGFASVGVGIPGVVSANIEAQLDLLKLSVPVTVRVNLSSPDSVLSHLQLRASAEVAYSLKTLSGRVLGNVETPFGKFSETMFQWDGLPAINQPLARTTWQAPMSKLIGTL